MTDLRLAIRVYGIMDGSLIWTARRVQRHSHRAAWPFWALSDRYENWRFRRMWTRIERQQGGDGNKEPASPREAGDTQ